MKLFLAITLILGCMAFLEARVLKNSAEQGAGLGNPFFAGGNSNDGDVGGSPVIAPGGGVSAGGGNADDDGGDTPDSPDGPGVVAAGGGGYGGFGNDANDGGGDTPDDGVNVNSPARPIGRGGNANNPDQRVIDDTEQAADPGQIVGTAGTTGATIGIIAGVVALVGVAAGVAIYVIKKRN